MSTPTPEQLRHLLLHRLSEEDEARLEEQLMQDAETADLLHHEETDLVDDYAQGRLSGDDRRAFEEHLLSDPRVRQRVKVARGLRAFAASRAAESGGLAAPVSVGVWNRWPIRAAAVFVLCAVALGLVLRATRHSDGPGPGITQQTPGALETGPDDTVEPASGIVLLADVGRGGSAQVVQVRAGAGPVRLQAEATSSDSSLSYRLSITDESGGSVFGANDLRPRESGGYVFVEVAIPARVLGTGARTVTLEPQRPGVESFTWKLDVQAAPN